MKTKLFIIGPAFITMTTLASARNQGPGQRYQTLNYICLPLVDNNENGICDFRETPGK